MRILTKVFNRPADNPAWLEGIRVRDSQYGAPRLPSQVKKSCNSRAARAKNTLSSKQR